MPEQGSRFRSKPPHWLSWSWWVNGLRRRGGFNVVSDIVLGANAGGCSWMCLDWCGVHLGNTLMVLFALAGALLVLWTQLLRPRH